MYRSVRAGHENSKVTMDIYAKVKYNKSETLHGVVNRVLENIVGLRWGQPKGGNPEKPYKIRIFQWRNGQRYGPKAACRAPQFSKR